MALSRDEELELAQLQKELAPKKLKTSGLSPMEEKELEGLQKDVGSSESNDLGGSAKAALQGVGQSATLGYLPQLQAATRPALKSIYESVTGEKVPDKSYLQARDEAIQKDISLSKKYPKSYLGGEIAGTIGSAFLPVGAGAEAATTLGKIGRAALVGGAYGAAANPGDTQGELNPLQAGDRLKNAASGAAVGAAAQGLMSVGGKALKAWENKGKTALQMSNSLALDSIGAKKADVKKLLKKDNVEDVANFVKKEGIAMPGSSFEDSYAKAKDVVGGIGKNIGSAYKQAQDIVNNPEFLKSLNESQAKKLADTEFVTKNIYNDIMSKVSDEFKSVAKGPQAIKQVKQTLAPIENLGEVADIDQLLKFRRSVDETINFDRSVKDMPQAQRALVKARQLLKEKIDQRIAAIDEAVGGNIGKQLKDLNKRFSTGSDVLNIAEDKIAREQANRYFGLTDTIAMGGGAGIGALSGILDPHADAGETIKRGLEGAALGMASRNIRRYGPAVGTQALDSIGRMLERDPSGKLAGLLADKVGLIPSAAVGYGASKLQNEPVYKRKP